MARLSVVIIGKNEEKNIEECIESVKFADEIIYFDNGSQDTSKALAKKKGATVFDVLGNDFSSRKNIAYKKAKYEWILSIDADERVTSELQSEIISTIGSSEPQTYSAFAIPRKNIILGKELKYGGWWPDYVVRLFLKKDFNLVKGVLHEQPQFKGKLGYLKSPLIHKKHDNLSDMLAKTNEWSEVEAKLMFDANHPPMNVPRFLTAGFREFWHRVVVKRGFFDGTEGVIYSLYQVISRLISYMKLWEMQLKK